MGQLVGVFMETNCTFVLGTCRRGVFLPVSDNVPECWVGFLKLVRLLSLAECTRAMVSSFADFPNKLPGHDRFKIDAERDPVLRSVGL